MGLGRATKKQIIWREEKKTERGRGWSARRWGAEHGAAPP